MTGGSRGRLLFVDNEVCDFLSHRIRLAHAARDLGFEVHVAAPDEPGIDQIRSEGFPFHLIPLRRKSANPAAELRCFAALLRLYRTLRPSVIHQFRLKPTLYGGIAARLCGADGVVSLVTGLGHLFITEGFKARALRIPVKAGFRFAFGHRNSVTIFQNPEDRDAFVTAGLLAPENTVLMRGSGVDPEQFFPAPEPEGVPVVLLASRMIWPKGIQEFVDSARALKAQGVAARFVLAGKLDHGHPSAVPLSQLEAWDKEGITEWWGWRDDMPTLMAQANIVCLPSYREGVPRVLIEAAASGRAAITTDTPGCREIVRNGVNGLLVPPRESAGLTEAIRLLLANPAMRAAMGARGREIAASDFTLAGVISETLGIYSTLTSRRGLAAPAESVINSSQLQ